MEDDTEDDVLESNLFLLSWDNTGLEGCINVTEKSKEKLFDTLKGDGSFMTELGHIVNMMMLRARFNHHRHYEIYTIRTDSSMTEEDLRNLFESTPQAAADLIRDRGTKLYSDRATKQPVIT